MWKFLRTIYYRFKDRNRKFGWFQEVDERNFLGKNIAGQITRADLNDHPFVNFDIAELINQSWTDFCVACGEAYGAEGTEGMPMSWAAAFALYCRRIGFVSPYGASILQMLMARKQYGIPERSVWEFKPENGRDWNADWKNLPADVLTNALLHRAGSIWEAQRPDGWDRFNTFRAYLWKFRDKKIAIQTGTDGHNITLIGQKFHPLSGELCLYGPDSYGAEDRNYRIGRSFSGWRYFNRTEANQLPAGNFAFDIERELAELLNTYNEKAVKVIDNPDCFIVRNGERHSLVNEYIALANNCLMYDPNNINIISEDEMNKIPLAEPMKFKDGQYWSLVQRILEKLNKSDILNQLKNL